MNDAPDDSRNDPLQDRLREAFPPPDFPRVALRERIEETLGSTDRSRVRAGRPRMRARSIHPAVRAALAAAAALMVFVAGSEYGRRTATPTDSGRPAASTPVNTPLLIQASGSRYVADLARFVEEAPRMSPEEREDARDVALSVLFAATTELLRENSDNALLSATGQLMYSLRQASQYPDTDGAIWF